MRRDQVFAPYRFRFSTLQRVEIAEIKIMLREKTELARFSTLQRVEIAEIQRLDAGSDLP